MRQRRPGVWEVRVAVGRDPVSGRSRYRCYRARQSGSGADGQGTVGGKGRVGAVSRAPDQASPLPSSCANGWKQTTGGGHPRSPDTGRWSDSSTITLSQRAGSLTSCRRCWPPSAPPSGPRVGRTRPSGRGSGCCARPSAGRMPNAYWTCTRWTGCGKPRANARITTGGSRPGDPRARPAERDRAATGSGVAIDQAQRSCTGQSRCCDGPGVPRRHPAGQVPAPSPRRRHHPPALQSRPPADRCGRVRHSRTAR